MNKFKRIEQLGYRPDIDGLRALAVLLVVGFHAFPQQLKGGFIGVDIFFVISGFLISKILFVSFIQNKNFSLVKFYSRRINRIFPSLIIMLVACFSLGWFVLLPDEYRQLNKHIMGGASFIANLLLWKENGYFDNAAVTKPLLHLWSLGIEEQFYLLWPLLIWIALKWRFNLIFTILSVIFLSFLLNIRTVYYDATMAFYLPQTRFWELLAGSLLALWVVSLEDSHQAAPKRIMSNLQAIVGLFLILIAVLVIKRGRYFPGWAALLPTLGTFLIICAGSRTWLNRVLLSNRLMVWIGLISFPLYLWHWPLLSYLHIMLGAVPPYNLRLLAVLCAIFLAWLTYRFIEKPLRTNHNQLNSSFFLLGLMILMIFTASIGYQLNGLPNRSVIKKLTKAYAQFTGPNWNYSTNNFCLKNYHVKGSEDYAWMFCIANKEEKPTLLLLGNSYANHLYPGLIQNNYFKYESILSIGTCDPQWFDRSMLSNKALTSQPCSGNRPLEQQRFINHLVENTASIRYAILSGLRLNPDEKYIANIKRRIDFLESHNVKVIIFIPHILLDYDIRNCFARFAMKPLKTCELSHKVYEQYLKNFEPLILVLKKTNPQVAFFNPNDLFCNHEKCSMIHKGIPLFRDQHHHLSEYGSIELAKLFEKWSLTNIPEIAHKTTVKQSIT